MAEEKKSKINQREEADKARMVEAVESWKPKTKIGMEVKSGEISDIEEILDSGRNILEPLIVDKLVSDLSTELITIGQSKGKFGGGKRSIWKQTQKKTKEGNKPKFATVMVVGNKNGLVGMGYGKSKETVPAREKAARQAKQNLIKIKRGCGSWECGCGNPHSVPYKVSGKCGSAIIELMPAPRGTGLIVEKEVAKVLALAGIRDVYSKTHGQTKTKLNLIKAAMNALSKMGGVKSTDAFVKSAGVIDGRTEK